MPKDDVVAVVAAAVAVAVVAVLEAMAAGIALAMLKTKWEAVYDCDLLTEKFGQHQTSRQHGFLIINKPS